MRCDAGNDFSRSRRLGDVIVRAGGKRFNFSAFEVAVGERDYRQLAGPCVSPQKPAQCEAIDAWHLQVQHHKIAMLFVKKTQRGWSVGRRENVKAGCLEDTAQSLSRVVIIINNENGCVLFRDAGRSRHASILDQTGRVGARSTMTSSRLSRSTGSAAQ